MQTRLCFYSYGVLVESDSPRVHEDLRHDFNYFISDWSEKDSLILHCDEDLKCISKWRPLLKINDSVIYQGRKNQRIGFFGRSYVEYDFKNRNCNLHCTDEKISYETIYMIILSYIGERLDRDGQHRLHGFGLTTQGTGAIVLAPSGGGKSTLAMELLKGRSAKILSDDTPVIDPSGNMYAFPQRISLKDPGQVPKQFLRKFSRVKHGEKFVVGTKYFADSIEQSSRIDWLILTKKGLRAQSQIRAISKLRVLWPLLKWLVIGYETPQVWQLYLRFSPTDLLSKIKILRRRLTTARVLITRSKVAELSLSMDPKESAQTLARFLGRTN